MAETQAITRNVGDQVIAKVEQLSRVGFTIPKDYNVTNAIKASMLKLQDLKDKNGRNVFEVCTPVSVQSALFKMVTKGLDISKNTAYAIVRGNQLCIDESYFGKVLQVKRIFPNFEPMPRVIYEGDEFEYTTDITSGRKILVKHTQKLSNMDNDFVGAYMYIPTSDGGQDLFIMTKKMILTAWSKSSSSQHLTHKQFTDKMVSKTIINSACNMIINSTPDGAIYSDATGYTDPINNGDVDNQPEFQESEIVEDAPVAEEIPEVKEPKPKKTKKAKKEEPKEVVEGKEEPKEDMPLSEGNEPQPESSKEEDDLF